MVPAVSGRGPFLGRSSEPVDKRPVLDFEVVGKKQRASFVLVQELLSERGESTK